MSRRLFPFALALGLAGCLAAPAAMAIPLFARQTGQNCNACHVSFPELTPYGRYFKLSGYTLGGGPILARGAFMIILTPRPEHALGELEASADSIVGRLQRDGPTADEMRRASAGLEFDFVSALQSNLGKAEMLESGLVFHGDPAYYKTQYARLEAVTAADVQRVAKRYLTPGRVLLSIVPQGKPELAAQPDRSTKVTVSPDGGHYIMEHD